jgi:hypothetical protein
MSVEQTKSSTSLEDFNGPEPEENGFYIKEVFNKSILLNVEL